MFKVTVSGIWDGVADLIIEILTALNTRTKPMSKDRYKIAASHPNSKSDSLSISCR